MCSLTRCIWKVSETGNVALSSFHREFCRKPESVTELLLSLSNRGPQVTWVLLVNSKPIALWGIYLAFRLRASGMLQ